MATGDIELRAHKVHGLGYTGVAEAAPANLGPFVDSISVGRLVEGEYPRWEQLMPEAEPIIERDVARLTFNPKYMATYEKFAMVFANPEMPLQVRGCDTALKPCVFTMSCDDGQLVSLLMPVRADARVW